MAPDGFQGRCFIKLEDGRGCLASVMVRAMRTKIVCFHTRTWSGAWMATFAPVVRRRSVRKRSRRRVADGVLLFPHIRSTMFRGWLSRCMGAVSAASLGTAMGRRGTMIAASGWRGVTAVGTRADRRPRHRPPALCWSVSLRRSRRRDGEAACVAPPAVPYG